jgi:hypothetical protein
MTMNTDRQAEATGQAVMHRRILAALILFQAALGLAWAIDNFGVIPAYGDTSDYLKRAETLEAHVLRPFTLPLLLRICRELGGAAYEAHLLFILQTCLSLAAVRQLAGVILPKRGKDVTWLVVPAVGLNPLLMHFNFTATPDALAMSLSLLAATSAWKCCTPRVSESERRGGSRRQFAIFLVTFMLAINTRGERIISLPLGIAAGTALHRLFFGTKSNFNCKKIFICILLGLCCNFFAGKILPKTDKVYNMNYNFTLYEQITPFLLFTRAEKIYPHLPGYIHEVLSVEAARHYDKNANYFYKIRDMLSPLGQQTYKDIITTAVRNDLPNILFDFGAGIFHYILSPVYTYFNFTGIAPDRQPQVWTGFSWFFGSLNWTYTRMAGHSPVLTYCYWLAASALVVTTLVYAIFYLIKYRKPINFTQYHNLLFFIPCNLCMLLVFAANPVLIHIRYSLTWHIFALTVLFGIVAQMAAKETGGGNFDNNDCAVTA